MVDIFRVGLIGLVSTTLLVGAYLLGQHNSLENSDEAMVQPKNLEEISKLNSEFERQQAELANRISNIKNRIETVKLNLDIDEKEQQLQSVEISERLEALNNELASATTNQVKTDVPIPPDSLDGKVINQPKSASGIPVSVLQNYQQETGVSPDEIEELMRRTE